MGESGLGWARGRPIDATRVEEALDHARALARADAALAFGEPAEGRRSWRFTHRQAAAALSVARRTRTSVVRYADVRLLACVVRDELLCESLYRTYLAPLVEEPDKGETLRRTLRAYLAAGGNTSSAAAALRVNRQTVSNRLRAFEEKVECTLDDCAAELEMALELDRRSPA